MEYTLERFDNGMHFILLDKKTIVSITKNNNKRAICRINDTLDFHCAIISKKDGEHYVNIGLTICKKLKIKKGSKIKAVFRIDKTEYQFDMPEELKEVLDTDENANKVFHSLTPGNQRGLIYLVTKVMSVDKRIERALQIADKIKKGVTSPKLVFK